MKNWFQRPRVEPEQPGEAPDPPEVKPQGEGPDADLQRFLARLGAEMVQSGIAVTEITLILRQVATAMGAHDATIVVLPTLVLARISGNESERLDLIGTPTGEIRLDKSAAVYSLARRASMGEVPVARGLRKLRELDELPPRFSPMIRILGHAFAALGVGLVLQAAVGGLAVSFVLGGLVGLVKLWIEPGSYTVIVFPAAASFGVSLLAFWAATIGAVPDPLGVLVPALITFLPGAQLTTAILEIAAGDIVSGAARLIAGGVQLFLLVAGILAAGSIIAFPFANSYQSGIDSAGLLGSWIGVVLLSLGFFLYFCGPKGSLYSLTMILLVTFAGQFVGQFFLGPTLGGFIGALVFSFAAQAIRRFTGGIPVVVTFMPAFWLLAPGAVGLISLAQSAGGSTTTANSLVSFTSSLTAIALGIVTGTAMYRSLFMRSESF